jgi:hypothetical protein
VGVVGGRLGGGRVAQEEGRLIYNGVSAVETGQTARHSLSTRDDFGWLAVLLVFSNHWPASLLSPGLVLLERSWGEWLEGGLALLLASVGELCAVEAVLGWRWEADGGGLWRRETDRWAGGRRGCECAAAGMVPGRSVMMAGVDVVVI